MSWIDLKVRKPAADDADKNGEVLWLLNDEGAVSWLWSDTKDAIAWMPIPEFTPIPEPPEGYEVLQDYNAEPDVDALYWAAHGEWSLRGVSMRGWQYNRDHIYAVPIKPPEPQYRPFQNAEEFRPFRDRWWRKKGFDRHVPPAVHTETTFAGSDWQEAFEILEFDDGTPFGIKIN